jgi:hypothetical protein
VDLTTRLAGAVDAGAEIHSGGATAVDTAIGADAVIGADTAIGAVAAIDAWVSAGAPSSGRGAGGASTSVAIRRTPPSRSAFSRMF